MSWFDATGFANLAKSALKEAQKTIDKALDIKDEEHANAIATSKTSSEGSNEETDIFFDNWGLKNSGGNATTAKPLPPESIKVVSGDGQASSSKLAMTSSLWGSFTGSFFDNPSVMAGEGMDINPVASQPKKSSLFLLAPARDNVVTAAASSWELEPQLCDDSMSEFGFSQSKLVVESEDEARSRLSSCEADEARSRLSSCEADEPRSRLSICEADEPRSRLSSCEADEPRKRLSCCEADDLENISLVEASPRRDVVEVVRRRDHSTSYKFNRLSVISSESDKKSSESVEVLGYGSGFTTSPDSPSYSGTSSGFRVSVAASTPESVEVIPDTPSSVEVINEAGSGRSSRTTSSPYMSPVEPPSSLAVGGDSLACSQDELSPDSVEVIPEEEEEDERSVADDSYASASESTATGTVTVLEQPQFALVKSDTVDSIKSLKSPHHKVYFAETPTKIGMMDSYTGLHGDELALTHGNRAALSLALTSVASSAPPGEDSELVGDKLKVSVSSNDDSMTSERTLAATDSSCEGTISSDDTVGATVAEDTSSDGTNRSQSSGYVKTMLAEAMGDGDDMVAREASPVSSESRSDLVKIESEQTSGHTSGDEIETTTSSDIEIISSPNGCDSSSTQSARHSPAKLLQHAARSKLMMTHDRADSPTLEVLAKMAAKYKGHQRESSETSSGGSEDSHCSEVDKLMKRINEMSEILEARESKLIDLSRINVDLQESNAELKGQLEAAMQSHVGTQDVLRITDEYTQRLSSLERKFQQAVREKESLRKQLEASRCEVATRLSTSELEALVKEKDEVIEELRKEGGKLSKQELQHSNIIKKLRVKERDADAAIKQNKEQLDELTQEVERLKRSLTAKEEVERTQIEAVHQLTTKAKRQEKELATVKTQLDDASVKLLTLNTALETANKELRSSQQQVTEKDNQLQEYLVSTKQVAREEFETALEAVRVTSSQEQNQLLGQIDQLQERLKMAENEHSRREESSLAQCRDLLRRLEAAEARNEELAQQVALVSRPLLRQVEAAQAAHSAQQAAWERQERSLQETLGDLQGRLSSLIDSERACRDECAAASARSSVADNKLAAVTQEAAVRAAEVETLRAKLAQAKQDKERQVSELHLHQRTAEEELKLLQRGVAALEQQLAVERAAVEAERRRSAQLQEQTREQRMEEERVERRQSPTTPHSSPTLSFGRASLTDSISSSIWPQFQDDAFECGSTSGRYSNVYDSLRSGNTTALLEGLQSQLKLREGEVHQLQWEMSRRDAERNALTTELSSLTARADDQASQLAEAASLRARFDLVQQRYDALLQMYGEKVEEAQELRLDLHDVKDMYKTQIDQLLKKETRPDV